MADDRKIVIELVAAGGADDDDSEKENDEEKETKKREKFQKKIVKQVVTSSIKEVVAWVDYDYQKYVSLTEDYKTQMFVNNVKTTINKVSSLGKSVYSAAKAGFLAAGPEGGLLAATVAGGFFVMSEAFSLMRQYETQSLNLNLADKEARYARTRLGLIDNGRGTQN